MYARLDYCHTPEGKFPSAVICKRGIAQFYEGDCSELILAHKEDDGHVSGLDFICPDEATAWKMLREIVEEKFHKKGRPFRIVETH